MKKLFAAFIIMITLAALLAGCSAASTSATSSGDIQTYADPMTEKILVSLNENDYTAFSADFDTSLKSMLTQAVFDQLVKQVQTGLGQYQSKIYVSAAVEGAVTTVLYIARYDGEPAGVAVTITFQVANGTTYVHGFNLDSPNLRGQPVDVPQLLAYADPVTENVLVSINNHDYDGFLKDMNSTMRAAESQKAFDQIYDLLQSRAGDYVSKEFGMAASQQEYLVVRYLAKYTDEPSGVWITISFDKDQQVAGLYFDSPKLRGK